MTFKWNGLIYSMKLEIHSIVADVQLILAYITKYAKFRKNIWMYVVYDELTVRKNITTSTHCFNFSYDL